MTYDVGDAVRLSTTVTDVDGVATAATMALLVTKPDGTTTSPAITSPSTGVYRATVTADQPDTWHYTWTASGAVVAVEHGQFTVTARRTLFASLEDLKRQLNIPATDTTQDDEIRVHLEAANDIVEWMVGPATPTEVTETVYASNTDLLLTRRPVTAVTAITALTHASVVDVADLVVYSSSGVMRRASGLSFYGQYEVEYTVGFAAIPAAVKLATLIIAQHLWQTQSGGGGLPFPGTDQLVPSGMGFAIPNRARELLRPYSPPPSLMVG
jgi:hypothetical protein